MSSLQPLPEIAHHEKLPPGAQEIARIQMQDPKNLYVFIKYGDKLIIHDSRDAIIRGKPDYICGQIALPMGFLSWFPQALEGFLKPPSEGGLAPGKMSSAGEDVDGEMLGIIREMGDRAWPQKGPPPGYAVVNYSRDDPFYKTMNCPMEISFPESYLYNEGLLDFIKHLGDQYKAGLL